MPNAKYSPEIKCDSMTSRSVVMVLLPLATYASALLLLLKYHSDTPAEAHHTHTPAGHGKSHLISGQYLSKSLIVHRDCGGKKSSSDMTIVPSLMKP